MKALVHPETLVNMPEVTHFLRFAEPPGTKAGDHTSPAREDILLREMSERNIVANSITSPPILTWRNEWGVAS